MLLSLKTLLTYDISRGPNLSSTQYLHPINQFYADHSADFIVDDKIETIEQTTVDGIDLFHNILLKVERI